MYLARYAKEVQIVVRRDSLRDTMSQYLIDQIEKTPNIRLRPRTELERVEGDGHVERVALIAGRRRGQDEGSRRGVRVHRHPAAKRLAAGGRAARRQRVRPHRPGPDGGPTRSRASGRSAREPLPLETSVPGVFAAGDLRAGAMNRVASAVGEGSMVVRLVHEYLALT